MKRTERNVKLFDMVISLSRALDLFNPTITDHHLKVAYIAHALAEQMGLDAEDRRSVLLAGALHDVGAVSSPSRALLMNYELGTARGHALSRDDGLHHHGAQGSELIGGFSPFAAALPIIRFHHVAWDRGAGLSFDGEPVPLASHLVHLADRISVQVCTDRNILSQADSIRRRIRADAGALFQPEAVDAFDSLAEKESFWLDLSSPDMRDLLSARAAEHEVMLELDELQQLAGMFGRIVDTRSPFTRTHSIGVAAIARALAEQLGMSENYQQLLSVAGHLHDIGKLVIPPEILDKQAPLTQEERWIVKQHPYYTYHVLRAVPNLETVNAWASLHHERLDGSGYPFRNKNDAIPFGARIIAVADNFVAITEDRPYRKGMSHGEARRILNEAAASGHLDQELVGTVLQDFDRFYQLRRQSLPEDMETKAA